MEAALKGSREIGFTIVSITLSLIAVFIPLFLMGGYVGKLFQEFAVTISVSLILSLIISLTLTPMMCARLLKHENKQHGCSTSCLNAVSTACWRCIRAACMSSCDTSSDPAGHAGDDRRHRLSLRPHSQGLFPEQDTGLLQGITERATDISFPAMVQRQQAIIDTVLKDPAVESVTHYIGPGGPTPTLNQGRVFVVLKPLSERGVSASSDTTARSRAREDAGHRALSAGGPGHHHRRSLSRVVPVNRFTASWRHSPRAPMATIVMPGRWSHAIA